MDGRSLLDHLEAFAVCNSTPGKGITRFSWSEADRQARELLRELCEKAGLTVSTDGAGNMRARLECGNDPKALVLGSHLDSVRNGGRLDGIYGVCAALEVMASLPKTGLRHPVELVAFAEEEGSNFGCTCLGSKLAAGLMDANELRNLGNGEGSAWDKLHEFGLKPEEVAKQKFTPASTLAYLEAHIEQNRILESENKNIGIVTAIRGMRLISLTMTGISDHAASPMQSRRDPMAAFANFAATMEKKCRAGQLGADLFCTVGHIECRPNVGIVVPSEVIFTVDLRHVDVQTLNKAQEQVIALAGKTAALYGVDITAQLLSASGGISMDSQVSDILRSAAQQNGARWRDIISGPAHDAACMAHVAPTGMIFVPSINGLSHCPQEDTAEGDLILGARVLADAALKLAS